MKQSRSITPPQIMDATTASATSFVETTNVTNTKTASKGSRSSWRSTGWTPLAYPSSALFQPIRPIRNNDNSTNNTNRNNMTYDQWQLNSFFPLHGDVLKAATRELLILDGSLDPKSLDIVTTSTTTTNCTTATSASATGTVISTATGNDLNGKSQGQKMMMMDQDNSTDNDAVLISSDNDHHHKKKCKNLCGGSKRKHGTMLASSSSSSHCKTQLTKHVSFAEHVSRCHSHNRCPIQNKNKNQNRNHDNEQSGEDLANMIMKKCIWNWNCNNCNNNDENNGNHNGIDGGVDDNNNDQQEEIKEKQDSKEQQPLDSSKSINSIPSLIQLSTSNSNNDCNHNNNVQPTKQTIMKRPRMVSEDFTLLLPTKSSSTSPFILSNDIISPHLAVVAINDIQNHHHHHNNLHMGNDGKVLHSVQAFMGTDNFTLDHQEMKLLQYKSELPCLLDISIMVESYLRTIAYQITYQLTSYFNDKAVREFLGYKSSALTKDRILHLMADFLFDVSHAMFAWDQTETEIFACGNNEYHSHQTNMALPTSFLSSAFDEQKVTKRDQMICDTLFDNRALRKIGGFDSSSLLYHAVSMKHLRSTGEKWTDLAKSTLGKKMLRHHLDDQARVQVGQLRRGQRIRKSRSALYPLATLTSSSSSTSRSRSLSLTSIESDPKHAGSDTSMDDDNSIQNQFFLPGTLPITVSRQDTSKSWGILLAKEGSMCVVMRVPMDSRNMYKEKCPELMLQKGDLIVSIHNERNETVTTNQGHRGMSSDWFNEAVALFKRSCTLRLNVRRVRSMSTSR